MSSSNFLISAVDLEKWPRKQHFELFQHFSQPYFNICLKINAKNLYSRCKKVNISFFHGYVYCLLRACHLYKPMMLRIINQKPCYVSSTRVSVVELADDDSFRFSYFDFYETLQEFLDAANVKSHNSKANPFFSKAFNETQGEIDLIHVSTLPWLNFSSFSHAFNSEQSVGIPKFVFGKYNTLTGDMPLSIDVHHGLMDGLHVARFVNILQQQFDAM